MASPGGGLRAGTTFGPYELRSLIGVGGMGEVYRAYDRVKDRIVALKLLRPELAADADFQERFRRESRVAARLQEPHVVPVHDWGDIGGVLFIDMRMVEGANVKDVLRDNGPLDPARATSIVAQVAAALDAAHADGLVHRDVKPENVLLTRDDFAYLVDFGIARAGADSGLTRTGAAIGSCAYMAPERFTRGQVGPQADVYSLACLLYECLTGKPPFPMRELSQVMSAHILSAPPQPSVTRPGLNRAFDPVIARGMAKQPTARFPSAGELAGAATRAAALPQSPSAIAARPGPPSSTRQFAAVYPNLAETGHTPYSEYARLPEAPVRRRRFGRVQLILAAVTVLALAAAGLLATSLILRGTTNEAVPPTPNTTDTTAAPLSIPGTDPQGFLGYPGARCDPGSTPAVMAQTTKSVLVVCQTGPGIFSYRAVRVSDGASIELANAVRSSGGFDVTNPGNGVRYEVRPNQVAIVQPDGQASLEPMVQYASS